MKRKLTIIAVLVVTIGLSYALFTNNYFGLKNQVAITGDIYMHYNGSETITMMNVVSMTKEEVFSRNDNIFNFTITGKKHL